jgi:DNA polymerase III alpha subunit
MWSFLRLQNQSPHAIPLNEVHQDNAFIPLSDEWTALLKDYAATGFSTGQHPVPFLREQLKNILLKIHPQWKNADAVWNSLSREKVFVLGLLAMKQRPPTAKGLTFLTLEDETGFINLTLSAEVYEHKRLVIDGSRILAACGLVEKSYPSDPKDPRTSAVSIKVTDLWNPILNSSESDIEFGRPRAYR